MEGQDKLVQAGIDAMSKPVKHTPLIAMVSDIGLGHFGEIIITTQERVDSNQDPIAQNIPTNEIALEIVKRWNSHDALLEACDEGLHECERVKMHCTCKHKDLGGLLKRIERIEAAIAEAKKEGG